MLSGSLVFADDASGTRDRALFHCLVWKPGGVFFNQISAICALGKPCLAAGSLNTAVIISVLEN